MQRSLCDVECRAEDSAKDVIEAIRYLEKYKIGKMIGKQMYVYAKTKTDDTTTSWIE